QGAFQTPLNLLGSDVFAARGLDQVLLAVSNAQIALLIQLTDVPCCEPAVLERLRRGLRHVVITAHHSWTLDQNFAVVGDLNLSSWHRRPNGAETGGTRIVNAGANAEL